MVPFRLADGRTLCLPNAVAIIAGTARGAAARRFVDFLLEPATEVALAQSPSRQIPLGRIDERLLPAEVLELAAQAQRRFPVLELQPAREPCLQWLRSEYAP
jgi:ABC-type Fe3+ transport system substrate-binding protein